MVKSDNGSRPEYRTPRWVKLSGAAAAAMVVLIGIAILSGGEHGPWQHAAPAHKQ